MTPTELVRRLERKHATAAEPRVVRAIHEIVQEMTPTIGQIEDDDACVNMANARLAARIKEEDEGHEPTEPPLTGHTVTVPRTADSGHVWQVHYWRDGEWLFDTAYEEEEKARTHLARHAHLSLFFLLVRLPPE